jgi:hypothetical protein
MPIFPIIGIAAFVGFLFIKNKDRRAAIASWWNKIFSKKSVPQRDITTYEAPPLNVRPIDEKK